MLKITVVVATAMIAFAGGSAPHPDGVAAGRSEESGDGAEPERQPLTVGG